MTSHTQRFLVVVVKIAPRDAQSRENSNTCNAMATELVDHITSIMCIIEKTSSDISGQRAFTPPEHIKRHCNNVKVRKLYSAILFILFLSFHTRYVTKHTFFRMASLIVRLIFGPVILHASLGWSLLKTFLLKACCYKEKTWRILLVREQSVLSMSFLFPRTTIDF